MKRYYPLLAAAAILLSGCDVETQSKIVNGNDDRVRLCRSKGGMESGYINLAGDFIYESCDFPCSSRTQLEF